MCQEQEQRSGRQGLRAGAEFRLRPVLQEQEKLSGRQGSDLSFNYLMRVAFDPGLKEEHKQPAHHMVMRSLFLSCSWLRHLLGLCFRGLGSAMAYKLLGRGGCVT